MSAADAQSPLPVDRHFDCMRRCDRHTGTDCQGVCARLESIAKTDSPTRAELLAENASARRDIERWIAASKEWDGNLGLVNDAFNGLLAENTTLKRDLRRLHIRGKEIMALLQRDHLIVDGALRDDAYENAVFTITVFDKALTEIACPRGEA